MLNLLDMDMSGPPAPQIQVAPGVPSLLAPAAPPTGFAEPAPAVVDDFGGFEAAPAPEPALYVAYEDASLKVELRMSRDPLVHEKTDYTALSFCAPSCQ